MKTLKTSLVIIAASLPACTLISCAQLDVMVDKSQLKTETATHAYYPSTAVTPVVNPDALNALINDNIAKANEALKEATK